MNYLKMTAAVAFGVLIGGLLLDLFRSNPASFLALAAIVGFIWLIIWIGARQDAAEETRRNAG